MRALHTCLVAWVWFVACVDIWFTIHNAPVMLEVELNPVAAWLIRWGGIETMVAVKVFGTYIATKWLEHLPVGYSMVIGVLACTLLFVLCC